MTRLVVLFNSRKEKLHFAFNTTHQLSLNTLVEKYALETPIHTRLFSCCIPQAFRVWYKTEIFLIDILGATVPQHSTDMRGGLTDTCLVYYTMLDTPNQSISMYYYTMQAQIKRVIFYYHFQCLFRAEQFCES